MLSMQCPLKAVSKKNGLVFKWIPKNGLARASDPRVHVVCGVDVTAADQQYKSSQV